MQAPERGWRAPRDAPTYGRPCTFRPHRAHCSKEQQLLLRRPCCPSPGLTPPSSGRPRAGFAVSSPPLTSHVRLLVNRGLPALQPRLLSAVAAALLFHALVLWLIARPHFAGTTVAPIQHLFVRILNARATEPMPRSTDSRDLFSRLPPRRVLRPSQTPISVERPSLSTEEAAPVPSSSNAEQPPVPNASEAVPLRLDGPVLRAAAIQSKGAIRRLAEASGSQLPSDRVGVASQLEAAVAESARPSCLAPNPTGSLLSLPFIAYAAMTSQCK